MMPNVFSQGNRLPRETELFQWIIGGVLPPVY